MSQGEPAVFNDFRVAAAEPHSPPLAAEPGREAQARLGHQRKAAGEAGRGRGGSFLSEDTSDTNQDMEAGRRPRLSMPESGIDFRIISDKHP